jgi:hypothetical protein
MMKKIAILMSSIFISSCSMIHVPNDYYGNHEDLHPWVAKAKSSSGLGLQLHIHNMTEENIEWVKHLKPDLVRQDFFSGIENDDYCRLVNFAVENNAQIILTWKGPWEEGNDQALQAELAWKYARVPFIAWELGNEPNGHIDPLEYMDWSRSVSKFLLSINKEACIIGPASKGFSGDNLDWLLETIKHGALDVFDAVSIHYYWDSHDKAQDASRKLRKAIYEAMPEGRAVPVITSEGGVPDAVSGDSWKHVMAVRESISRIGFDPLVWYAIDGGSHIPVNSSNPTNEEFREFWKNSRN